MAPVNVQGKQILNNQPKTLQYNQFNTMQNDILLTFDGEGGSFILFEFHKDVKSAKMLMEKRADSITAAVFIAKDRICTLDKNKELSVCDFDGQKIKSVPLSRTSASGMQAKADNLFGGPIGKVLLQVEDDLVLYDISARKVTAELQAADVKQVYWSQNFNFLAIVTRSGIIMSNKNLEIINTVKETQRVKSGCFDENNSFIYSTSTHLKYVFCEGKTSGMFRSIEEPVYIAFFMRNTIYYFDRKGEMVTCEINNTDYLFKQALLKNDLQTVNQIFQTGNLCGHSIVQYLKDQNHQEIALFFEKDVKNKFNLAVQSGSISVAFSAAQEINEKEYYLKLAEASKQHGQVAIAEQCL